MIEEIDIINGEKERRENGRKDERTKARGGEEQRNKIKVEREKGTKPKKAVGTTTLRRNADWKRSSKEHRNCGFLFSSSLRSYPTTTKTSGKFGRRIQ